MCFASSEHTSAPEIATTKLRTARAGVSKISPIDADRFSAEYGRLERFGATDRFLPLITAYEHEVWVGFLAGEPLGPTDEAIDDLVPVASRI